MITASTLCTRNVVPSGRWQNMGVSTRLYVTHYPCRGCAHLISSCPEIVEVVYLDDYNNSSEATELLMGLSKGVHHVEE